MKNKFLNKKALLKSVIYRIYAFIITFFVTFFITGSVELSFTIGILENTLKIYTYYFFDIMWSKFTQNKFRCSIIWFTGLSSSGKTTIAKALIEKLRKTGHNTMLLDGDEIRDIFKNYGFDREARLKHISDISKMAAFLQKQGIIPVVSLISPYEEARQHARSLTSDFTEVYVSTSLAECERRDVKGLYAKARSGEIKDFTGIHETAPYEIPKNPELNLDTTNIDIDFCVDKILKIIKK